MHHLHSIRALRSMLLPMDGWLPVRHVVGLWSGTNWDQMYNFTWLRQLIT